MSEAFTTAIILLGTLLLFTHYIQKGFGGMSNPLRQFGMFLLTKAAGPAADMPGPTNTNMAPPIIEATPIIIACERERLRTSPLELVSALISNRLNYT